MRLSRLAQKFGVVPAAALVLAASAARVHGYAPPELKPPEATDPDGSSSVSISTTTGEKSSLPDDMPQRSIDGAEPSDALSEDGGADPYEHSRGEEATVVPPPLASISDVVWDISLLPGPVQATRQKLLEAARTGDIEALRPIFEQQGSPPIVAGFDTVDDPVDHLRLQSGDDEGREILAILVELLESGHVHTGDPTGGTYVWPYFAEVPLEELKAAHYVELYRVLTAIDVEEIARVGYYTFFRVGISADGRVRYFTAGALE